ncbi:MAG TPA: isoprenylcysteine carboxylmethyltransferase family protein [Candidatus Binatus sp.]|uniref:methyltransferase family protein n=1 Tax=Candidatus Binatus sp. TaxID=2811406 RepID=UPI002B4663F1|nr:isoprenylcysteine carboxylmethyltransferase family protein [Candidatus Binatus sp.]HKN13439.1 isoprenylcysteine carboxylmethyltransferase family protein [Candidatus Binatus sp.]
MNSTEPQSTSTGLSTTKIHPPLLAAALLLATLALHFILPEERTVGWYQVIGLLVVAFGAGLSCFAAAIFQARETTRKPWGEPTTFVVQAPYTRTRNPMYLGLATALFGLAIFFSSIAMLLAPAVFFAVIDRMVIPREEETLERLFGNDYADYKNRVRRWI